jgi:hypothetical protein
VRYTQVLAAGSIVAFAAALLRPDVAHLALRAILAVAVVTVGSHLARSLVRSAPPSPFQAEPPDHEISSPELPRDLAGLADELRVRGRYVSETIAARLSREFRVTLRNRRGLADATLGDERALSEHLSPMAAALVASEGRVLLPRRQLDSILDELEHL